MNLDVAERWLQAVITEPEAPAPAPVEDMVVSTPALSAHDRLAIYARAYRVRLLDCLRTVFPALRHALGDDLFTAFALDYLARWPPRSASLDRLADNLPGHLERTRPAGEDWPHFVVDLASLELLCADVFDGPGLEGVATARPRDVLALPADGLGAAVPRPAPCLRTFTSRYPVHAYLLATRRGDSPALPPASDAFVAVTRRNYRVQLFELSAEEHRVLSRLDGRRTVAGAGRPAPLATLRGLLLEWTTRGFIQRIDAAPGD